MWILLDVILADEDQEERTSLHLPALFDELQGILHAHSETKNTFQIGTGTYPPQSFSGSLVPVLQLVK